jgi:exopolysaccharide biosynthesis WecB/TagA/CpsF family protein
VTALTYQFDDFDLKRFLDVAVGFGQSRYGYVVTPNTDHMIRLHDEPSFRASYAEASYVLLDSRVLAYFLRLTRGLRLPVCAGSDLTAELFARVIRPDDPLILIGGSEQQAQMLAERYGLKRLAHFNPPMGFIRDPEQVEICLRFIEAHSPFRFCFLGVGAPQQEMLAQRLRERGHARGLALCIGASIDFLTGAERRAPRWMQVLAIEWVFRLLNNPGRLARRYLVRGPRILGVLRGAQVVLRPVDITVTSASVQKTDASV